MVVEALQPASPLSRMAPSGIGRLPLLGGSAAALP